MDKILQNIHNHINRELRNREFFGSDKLMSDFLLNSFIGNHHRYINKTDGVDLQIRVIRTPKTSE
jgi:hypothetical protein